MSPASARALRRRRVAELRAAEPDLSLRQMADRLGISRDTVTRDLDEIDRAAAEDRPAEPSVRPVDDSAPQLTEDTTAAAGTDSAPSAAPVAEAAPPAEDTSAALPRRIRPRSELTLDLGRSPALRRGLAELAATGLSPEALIAQAVVVLAVSYREGVARGDIRPDAPFLVRGTTVGPPEPGHAVPRRALRDGA
ncbi:HTH domain-containing protein [Streptomyces sp. NPDC048386]|uniref:HTH domain-containing protein n=1 Tax=Streptomyces sp. NPDC048386 TaxID=3365541 RepID=UPI0037204D07